MTDKVRLRIKFEVVTEYDANPEHYPGCNTPEDMLALDLRTVDNDPLMLMQDTDNWTITGEVVVEDGK